jgi:hypothetical protein
MLNALWSRTTYGSTTSDAPNPGSMNSHQADDRHANNAAEAGGGGTEVKIAASLSDAGVNNDVVRLDQSQEAASSSKTERRFSLEDESLFFRECDARRKAIKNPLLLPLLNFVSTLFIFIFFLVSFEMFLSVALSVTLTVYYYNQFLQDESLSASSLNLILLTFAVVTPIMAIVSLAFKRRDEALYAVSDLRSTLQQLYMSHALWDWGFTPGNLDESGRTRSSVDWLEHSDKALSEIFRLAHDLSRFLTLPNSTRARHRVTYFGRKEAARTNRVGFELYDSSLVHLGKLSALCEVLKREGLPPNEATRVRQWERLAQVDMEKIRIVKLYRTPQALRSFGRLFSVFLPPFFGPFYADVSIQMSSQAIGLAFAVITSVALTGLFETVSQFEDPFVNASRLDGIKVREELVESFTVTLLKMRRLYFPNAPEFKKSAFDQGLELCQQTRAVLTARIISDD